MRLRSLLAQGAIEFYGRVVQAKLNHRQIRCSLLHVIAQPQARDGQFGSLELVKRVAEVDNQKSPLCPSSENTAVWPATSFSIFSSAAEASAAISCCCAGSSFRHSAQRKRNIWCNTLEPSIVSGTACRSFSGIFISALVVVAIYFLCLLLRWLL